MGNKQKKSSGGKKKKKAQNSVIDPDAAGSIGGNSYGLIMVDPARCRFQHSKIRPYFSGCGRSVHDTLEDIKEGKTNVMDIPPIQVLVGDESMDDDQGQWYFSLNNRRLWVLKRLREEGHLEKYGNKIAVRVRRPKSQQERERYTLANCALEARIIPEKKKTQQQQQPENQNQPQQNENRSQSSKPKHVENNVDVDINIDEGDDDGNGDEEGIDDNVENENDDEDSDSDSDDDDDSQAGVTMRNRFAITMLDDSSSSDDDDD